MSARMPLCKKSKLPIADLLERFLLSTFLLLCNFTAEWLIYDFFILIWKKKKKQYHPDMNKALGAEEKFKEISAAYEVPPIVGFCPV